MESTQKEITRNCPNCNKILTYKTIISKNRANKKGSKCFKCCNIGQTITQEQREKISKTLTGRPNTSSTKYKKGDNRGSKSPMFGKSTQICLVEKYGLEEGNRRYETVRAKLRTFNGKKSATYGKQNKQGNGYSGWYKDWFFRSLTELSYAYNLELENKTWISAETLPFYIEYVNEKGYDRTYRPDFLVEGNILVEIKPLRLQSSKICIAKSEAAKKFCVEKGYTYLLTDCKILDVNFLKSMYDNKIIKFTDKNEKRFLKYYETQMKKAAKKQKYSIAA